MTALETQVATRKQQMIAEIVEHKKNSSRAGAADAVDRIKIRLSELADIVKDGVADGRPKATVKLTAWMAR